MINSRDEYEIEKIVDKKLEEYKTSQKANGGCFNMIFTVLFVIFLNAFVVMPFLLTIIEVYKELIKRGMTPFQAINLAPYWSVHLAPMIADWLLKVQ